MDIINVEIYNVNELNFPWDKRYLYPEQLELTLQFANAEQ